MKGRRSAKRQGDAALDSVRELCVATLNVSTLVGRVQAVADLAASSGVGCLCLQETRLHEDSFVATKTAFRHLGWALHVGPQGLTSNGQLRGGVAVLTDWPAQRVALPEELEFGHRCMALKLSRPQLRPLLVVNLYAPAHDFEFGTTILQRLMEWLATTGEDWVLMGDFNREQSQFPIAHFLSAGQAYACDPPTATCGTRRDEHGVLETRRIDYGLAKGVISKCVQQQRGVADHDLVAYNFGCCRFQAPLSWPPRRSLGGEITEDAWLQAWSTVEDAFEEAIKSCEAQTAWKVLSDFAEEQLGRGAVEALPRSQAGKPGQASRCKQKVPVFQTLLERQLRRVARRAAEAVRCPTDALLAQLSRDLDRLSGRFSPLQSFSGTLDSLCSTLLTLADEEAARARDARIRSWKEKLQGDVGRMARWITASINQESTSLKEFADDPSLQAQADRQRAALSALWNDRVIPHAAAFSTVLHASAAEAPGNDVQNCGVSAEALWRRARASKGRAAGADGWKGSHFAALPRPFFNSLATIWRLILDGAAIPEPWLVVRVVCVPKAEGGGTRPLALASLAWRLGAAVLLRDLKAWQQRVFPTELCGGIPGRQVGDVHQALFEVMDRPGAVYAGYKADLRKCFDQVVPEFAIQAWEHLGGPRHVARLLRRFYNGLSRWVGVQGIFARDALVGSHSLLQGCPCSVALLNSLSTIWLRALKQHSPAVQLRTFVDDRTVWVVDRSPVPKLVSVAQRVGQLDYSLGFEQHPQKLASFASGAALRQQLQEHTALVGAPDAKFSLLGLPYSTSGRAASVDNDLTASLRQRSRRIQMVGQSFRTRAMLASLLILSKLRFVAAWIPVDKGTLQRWVSLTEQAIWGQGGRSGRSAYLFWTAVAGVFRHPGYVVHAEVLMQYWRRLGADPHCRPRKLTLEALRQFGWVAQGPVWTIEREPIDVRWLSQKALLAELRHTWQRYLWSADTKTTRPLLKDEEPCHQQQVILDAGGNLAFRTVVGCAADGRILERLKTHLACDCGEAVPTRTHFTFDCPAHPWEMERRSEQEQRLLTATVQLPPRLQFGVEEEELAQIETLTRVLCDKAKSDRPLTFALDGGATQVQGVACRQTAAWAIVDDQERVVASGYLWRRERSAAAAERQALFILASALVRASLSIAVRAVMDNLPLVTRLQSLRGGTVSAVKELWPFWQVVTSAADWIQPLWVPSHGKRPQWRPTDALDCEGPERRRLNAAADGEVARLLAAHSVQDHISTVRGRWRQARAWSRAALQTQLRHSLPFHDAMKAALASQNRGARGSAAPSSERM